MQPHQALFLNNLSMSIPRDQMGEMETDRPDVKKGAYKVEMGQFQLERDLIKFVRNSNGKQSSPHIFLTLAIKNLDCLKEPTSSLLSQPTLLAISVNAAQIK